MTAVLVLLAIVAIVAFWGVGVYNRIIALRNYFENAFSQIDVQLKRRYDLIPNLVETAKAYMAHERETLEAVIAARNHAVDANKKAAAGPADAVAFKNMVIADNALDATLGKFFALSEAYPDLKANHTMMQLSEELSSTENRIAFARQGYNDSVMSYNVAIQQFPGSLIANSFGFRRAELLESTESPEERKAIKVTF
ncbi:MULTISPECIES: LemA family protein [Oxalobacteraceae]|uniref:LemA family protein n=1 Tax=Herminiimonas sp. Marseille-P9896 TaxID=2742211 RepID=UPI0015883A5A|nr:MULTISPECIES: LemA family protein [Oxalobacteraceae]